MQGTKMSVDLQVSDSSQSDTRAKRHCNATKG